MIAGFLNHQQYHHISCGLPGCPGSPWIMICFFFFQPRRWSQARARRTTWGEWGHLQRVWSRFFCSKKQKNHQLKGEDSKMLSSLQRAFFFGDVKEDFAKKVISFWNNNYYVKPRPFVAQAVSKVPRGSTQVWRIEDHRSWIELLHPWLLKHLPSCNSVVFSNPLRNATIQEAVCFSFFCVLFPKLPNMGCMCRILPGQILWMWPSRKRTSLRIPLQLVMVSSSEICMMWMHQFDLFILWLTVAALNRQAANSCFWPRSLS